MTTRTFSLRTILGALPFAAATMAPAVVSADELECRLHQIMPVERQLRRLSLALRGHIPAHDEYALVEGAAEIPDGIIDDYLASDAYRRHIRTFHDQLLWGNPAGAEILGARVTLTPNGHGALDVFGRRPEFRGGNGQHTCVDVEQAPNEYDPVTLLPQCKATGFDGLSAWCKEGWVMVAPYWDPTTPIKVCAFDAQANVSWFDDVSNATADCGYSNVDGSRKGCGCGPDLKWCAHDYRPDMSFSEELWAEMREQTLLTVDDHSRGERPYSELLTTRTEYVNGAIEFFRKNLAVNVGYGITYNVPHEGDAPIVGEPDWFDRTWRPVEREHPHSGVLTSLAYSLRFQTNRARANRYRISFMGQYFVPPSVYDQSDCSATAADLTQRCVCKSCHAVLEPLATHFGPIAERGSSSISHFIKECTTLAECLEQLPQGKSIGLLDRFYPPTYTATSIDHRLAPLEFMHEHPEYVDYFDAGPAALVSQALTPVDGAEYSLFARSIVEKLFKFFMKREMNLDPAAPDNEIAILEELAADFTTHDDFRRLVTAVVRLDAFRRMP